MPSNMNVAEKECCFIACFLRGFQAHGACFLRGSQAHGSGWTFGTGNEKRTQTSFVNGMIACETMPQSPQQGKCFPAGRSGGRPWNKHLTTEKYTVNTARCFFPTRRTVKTSLLFSTKESYQDDVLSRAPGLTDGFFHGKDVWRSDFFRFCKRTDHRRAGHCTEQREPDAHLPLIPPFSRNGPRIWEEIS